MNTALGDEWSRIEETAGFLKSKGVGNVPLGIVLGTGLGGLIRVIEKKKFIPFDACPFFPRATSIGHAGRLVYGLLHGKKVLAMEGRFHFFEGYELREIAYPVRVMKALGVHVLFLSNAAGGLDPGWALGDIMLITDHINLMGDSPLAGPNDERLGERFPDMSEPYDPVLRRLAAKTALALKVPLRSGVYAGVKGPQLETRAEYGALRMMGADAVGMSTIPEVIVARHAGMRVIAFSCITDLCLPDALEPIDIRRILRVAAKAEPVLSRLVSEMVRLI